MPEQPIPLVDPWAEPSKPKQSAAGPVPLVDPWANEPAPQPQEQGSFLTRSLLPGVGNTYDQAIKGLESTLPTSMRGNYAEQLFGEVIKQGGHGMVDFVTSPVGLGLIAAHAIPVTAPFAAAGDVLAGGWSALQSVPDIATAIQDHSPQNVARVIVDLAGAYGGVKGGARIGEALRQIPAGTPIRQMPAAYATALRTTPPPGAPGGEGRALRQRLESAPEQDRPDILAEAEKPTSIRGALEQRIYRTPGLRAVASVILPGVKRSPILDLAQSWIDDRESAIAREDNIARRLGHKIRTTVPEPEQNIRQLGYAMEGDLPAGQFSQEGQTALQNIRDLNRRRDAMFKQVGTEDDSLRDPESYITHYWDFREDPNSPVGRRLASAAVYDPKLRARKVGTLKQGIETGIDVDGQNYKLRPLYENTADVVERRHREAVRVIENRRILNQARELGLVLDPTPENIRRTGWKQMRDTPALQRAMYAGKTEEGGVIMRPRPLLVHPDVEMGMNAIFGKPFSGPLWNVADQLRGFSKTMQVGFSIFHNNALSEVGQAHGAAAGGWSALPRIVRALAWPLDPEYRKGVAAAIQEVRGKVPSEAPPDIGLPPDFVQDWLGDGLRVQSSEAESTSIRAARQFLADRGTMLKAVGAPVRMIGDIQHVFTRPLFDYYLPRQMMHAAENLWTRERGKLGAAATDAEKTAVRREIADHVNRSFGADNLNRLMLSPKAQQALGFAFFAPMWTLSNLRVLTKGFETTTGARLTRNYIAGAALTWLLTTQLANYAFSEWDAKHSPTGGEYWDEQEQKEKRGGHWTWQNEGVPVRIGGKYVPTGKGKFLSDNFANIYIGQNPDGSARYIRLGKAWREPFGWMTHPLDTLGNKISSPLRTLFVGLSGVEPGSGFPVYSFSDRNQMPIPKGRTVGGVAAERFGKFLTEQATPFAAQGALETGARKLDEEVFREQGAPTQYFGLPLRKGVNFNAAAEAYREAKDAGRMDVVSQIVDAAQKSGINPRSLELRYEQNQRATQRIKRGLPQTQQPPGPVPLVNPWQ